MNCIIFKPYFNWRLDKLLLLDLLAEEGVEKEWSGAVVHQPGRLLEGLQVRPLLATVSITSGQDTGGIN